MIDLYFISILDSIIGVCVLFLIFGIVATVAWIVCVVLNKDIDEENMDGYDWRCLRINNTVIKIAKPFAYVGIVALIIATFLPSTKQGYMIYGVGNTLEYIKSNEKAKELPNKVVIAIDKWLNKEINDNNKEDNNEN